MEFDKRDEEMVGHPKRDVGDGGGVSLTHAGDEPPTSADEYNIQCVLFLQRMRDVPTGINLGGPTIIVTRRMVVTLASLLSSSFFLFQQLHDA
jgi:hypothetical protein